MRRPPVLRVDPHDPSPELIHRAAQVITGGGLVAVPTETVYGLGANALDPAGVRRIFAAKGRPGDNPLIVHLSDADDLTRVAREVTALASELAQRWWPGPLTIVLDAAETIPVETTAGLSTVAVRVPAHPVARALISAAGVPIAAPSANRSGRPSPTTAQHVIEDLGDAVDLVLDGGPCEVGVESTVVDARGLVPIVLRDGAVTREDLASPAAEASVEDRLSSPGTRHRHYTPACRVVLASPGQASQRAEELAQAGASVGLIATVPAPSGVIQIAVHAGAEDLARRLYDALRLAESSGVEVVVVESVSDVGIGRAVMDRLRRAAD